MTLEDDNFDIDVYGDGGEEFSQEPVPANAPDVSVSQIDGEELKALPDATANESAPTSDDVRHTGGKNDPPGNNEQASSIIIEDTPASNFTHSPAQSTQSQGVKRKDGENDDRHTDPSATTALFLSDLHWWITDDDIRGWANQCNCENELEDITFNEHKVNGKSKGQAYVLFKSAQSATAVRQQIQNLGQGQEYAKNFAVSFSSPNSNPFRTLPKDGNMRNTSSTGANRSHNNPSNGFGGGNYRGRGTPFHNRGGNMNNFNRGGFQMGQTPGITNFSQMGSTPQYGTFQGRGGMMGGMRGPGMNFRGGRGGMMGMPMGMGMSGMMGGIGMGPMGAMGNQANFGASFFGQPQHGSMNQGFAENPHPAKRTRQD